MCLTQNPDAIPAEPFLKYPKVSTRNLPAETVVRRRIIAVFIVGYLSLDMLVLCS